MAVVYIIMHKDDTLLERKKHCYVGSTMDSERRQAEHSLHICMKTDKKLYNYINQNGGINEWVYDELTIYLDCMPDSDELKREEQEWIDEIKPELNRRRASNNNERIPCEACGKMLVKKSMKKHLYGKNCVLKPLLRKRS